jgi:uncharacterized membrane protein
MIRRMRSVAESLRTSFFFLPAVAVLLGAALARLLVGVDVGGLAGGSTVDSARAVFATTAGATITFASITFSVSLLIMQQGSNQFSPRVVHGLVRDPFNRRVIAVVVGTFTYCLVSLQWVRGPLDGESEARIPELAVTLGLAAGVVSVLAVVAAINHTARRMDVSVILGDIVAQTTAIDVQPALGDDIEPASPPARRIPDAAAVTVVRFAGDGWVREIDRRGLLGCVAPGSVVRLEIDTGRYAIRSTPLCTVWPEVPDDRLEEVAASIRSAVRLGPTRTMSEDAAYGVRQLVDVAVKALSPGVNDPTTAQDAIFHLGTVLVDRLSSPPVPSSYADAEGRCLLAPHALTDDELAELAVAELRGAAATQPAVAVYLLQAIGLVVEASSANGAADRVDPFVAQARLVVANVDAAHVLEHDRRRVHDTFDELFAPFAAADAG